MEAGKRYYVAFWVSASELMYNPHDNLGAYFSTDSLYLSSLTTSIGLTPHIKSPDGYLVADSSGWEKISGSFIADGGERWIVLGTFAPFLDVQFLVPSLDRISYYLVDYVCVISLDDEPSSITHQEFCVELPYSFSIEVDEVVNVLEWSDGDSSFSKTFVEPGKYWYRYINDNCELVVDTIVILDDHIIPINLLGPDTIICDHQQLMYSIDADTYSDILWSNGQTGHSTIINKPGQYWVAARDACNKYICGHFKSRACRKIFF